MDEFPGLLARDFGFRPQGKSAPMSAAKSSAAAGSDRSSNRQSAGGGISTPPAYDDVFGATPKNSSSSDLIFDGFKDPPPKHSSLPVYDKPVYDDDIFDGVPGMKNSASGKYDDVFTMLSAASGAAAPPNRASSPPYDDRLGNLGKAMPESKGSDGKRSGELKDQGLSAFDELIPGFSGRNPTQRRESPETKYQSTASSAKPSTEDPFAAFETASTSARPSSGVFTSSSQHITRPTNSGSSVRGDLFDDEDFTKSIPLFTSKISDKPKNKSPLKTEKEPSQRSSRETFENIMPKTQPMKSSESLKTASRNGVPSPDRSASLYERNGMPNQSPRSYAHMETADDVWLTVAEIPLFTQPTSAPPPSRPPPSLAIRQSGNLEQFSSFGANFKSNKTHFTSQSNQVYQNRKNSSKNLHSSPLDHLDDFVSGKPQRYANEHVGVSTCEEETETNSAASAMKEAMDRAEAKFKHAREVRERDRDTRSAKSREFLQQERYDKAMQDVQYPDYEEKQDRLVSEREQSEREEKEEQRRREKEREVELDRQRARQAVERATREARERAAAEARLKAERAAVEKANAEARQRAERAAFQKAAAEARERAAAEAREKAEKERAAAAEAKERERAAAEAREKERAAARERAAVERAQQEARLRAQRAAVERASEVRDRTAAEAQRRAAVATTAREKQQKTENDLETFFNAGVRPSSAPKQRNPTSESVSDAQFQNKGFSDGVQRTSPGFSSTIRKTHSTTNIGDDLASIFGAPSSSGEFQEVEGESEERRRARLERHQRTLERAAKALAEKNERDMQNQREQAERHRIAETLDFEIKRWAAGKEGNLRALLSTLQYVLWPECGWQPVSLTDLITGASVKKVYRKATLCIHPDKVQQKGATLQQKYIAEKVFDLLKIVVMWTLLLGQLGY